MIVSGFFEDGRPYVHALVVVSDLPGRPLLAWTLLIDSGADRTLVPFDDFDDLKVSWEELERFPVVRTHGIGGALEGRLVAAAMHLRSSDGSSLDVPFDLVVVPSAHREVPLVPILGRDVVEQFRLIIDSRGGIVALTDSSPTL